MELVLASSSPRRQDLLEEAGIFFRVVAPMVDEFSSSSHPELSPIDLTRINARMKAEAVAQTHQSSVILAADTIVYCENRILGKPDTMDHAREMLRWLSGKTHEVITGVTWMDMPARIIHEHVARTRVTFRALDEDLIESYLAKVHVLDKAGGYAFQEHGYDLIERIEGSKSNIIGLPMEEILQWHQGCFPTQSQSSSGRN